MMFEQMMLNIFLKVQIIHSIPGRIRLHIPYVKKIPPKWHFDERYFEILKRIKGIKKVEFSFTTANAVVSYDPQLISPDQLITTIREMVRVAFKNKKELSMFKPDQKDEALDYLTKLMEKHFDLLKL